MTPKEELEALRRMAELEAKAAGKPRPTESVAVAVTPAESAQTPLAKASMGDIVAGLPATRMIAGMAAPVVGAFQAGANAGDWIAEKMGKDPVLGKFVAAQVARYEAAKKRGMVALGENGPDIAGFAGNVISGGLAAQGIKPATTWGGRIAQGTAAGAVAGAVTPSVAPGINQTLMQTGVGAALGGGVPTVGPIVNKLGQATYRTLLEPLTNSGAIKGRAYEEAAGDKAQEIINLLRANRTVVPGSQPTAGEAAAGAGSVEFSALQKSAEKVPGVASKYLARADARNTARLAQLSSISKTPADLETAIALRKAAASKSYTAAELQGVDQAMAEALKPQIDSLMSRPSIQEAKALAVKLAKEQDITLTDFGSVSGLDWLKKGLDEQISAAAKAGSSAGKEKLAALLQTKEDLLATLEQIAPAYNAARAEFALNSKPINQMEVGQYLKQKLVPALDEEATQRANVFAGAVQDAPGTIRKSLDAAPRYTKLSDVLTPGQVAKVEAIQRDLANTARFEKMAKLGGQGSPNAIDVASSSISAATGGGKIPNPLSRVVTIANAIIGRLEGKIDKKLAIEIAAEMLDPTKVAPILEKAVAKTAKKKAMAAAVNKLRVPATAVATQNALAPVARE